VTGITLAACKPEDDRAFKELLQVTIEPSRKEAGNVQYHLYKHATNPGQFLYVESWASIPVLMDHIKQPWVEPLKTPYFKTLATQFDLHGPFFEVQPGYNDEDLEMIFKWDVFCPADKVWGVFGNFSDSSWLFGVKSSELTSSTTKVYHMENGLTLDVKLLLHDDKNFRWIEEGHGYWKKYVADVNVVPHPKYPNAKSIIRYKANFLPPDGTSIESVRTALNQDFQVNRIPFYSKQFTCAHSVWEVTATDLMDRLYSAFRARDLTKVLAEFDASAQVVDGGLLKQSPKDYYNSKLFLGNDWVEIRNAVDYVTQLDGTIIAIEDYFVSGPTQTKAWGQITRYIVNDGKIQKVEVIDNGDRTKEPELRRFMDKYFTALRAKDKEALRKLFAKQYTLLDPAGLPARTIDSVYDKAFSQKVFDLQVRRVYFSGKKLAFSGFLHAETPTGFAVDATPLQVWEIEEGKLKSLEAFVNLHTNIFKH